MTKYSQWQKQSLTLHPGVNDVTFSNARPNTFFVINSNNNYLYFSMSGIPSASRYDYRVKPNGIDAFGRPLPISILSIYSPADTDIVIELYSDDQPFDMSLLKAINMDLDDDQINKLKFDGIVKGWDTQDIVNVKVQNFTDLLDKLDDLLGSKRHIKSAKERLDAGSVISIIGDIKEIVSIVNDTDCDITITCTGNDDITFWLTAGERLDNINYMDCSNILITPDGTQCNGTVKYIVATERGT